VSGNGSVSKLTKKLQSLSGAWSGQLVSRNGAASEPFMALNRKTKSKEAKVCLMLMSYNQLVILKKPGMVTLISEKFLLLRRTSADFHISLCSIVFGLVFLRSA
jgi:hypothetical protein